MGIPIRNFKIQRNWLIVFLVVLSVPLLLNYLLQRVVNMSYLVYIAEPLVWILLGISILKMQTESSVGKLRMRPLLIKFALAVAFFQVYMMVVAGLFNGFGESPYSFTFKGILLNLFYVGAGLFGMELSRAWLINRLLRKPALFLPILIALLYTLVNLPLGQIPSLGSDLEAWTSFLGSICLPLSMEQLLASILAMWGGPLPALAYRGVLQAFEWFSPVLPDLNWVMKAFVGTVVPLVALAVIWEYLAPHLAVRRLKKQENEQGIVGIALSSIAVVMVLWFSLGVFPVKPVVIYSGSMRPSIEVGDLVIVAQQKSELLRVGDVISYRVQERSIPTIHRVIRIRDEEDPRIFITKGDDNQIEDQPVDSRQVTGKVVLKIPRVGWASIALKKYIIPG